MLFSATLIATVHYRLEHIPQRTFYFSKKMGDHVCRRIKQGTGCHEEARITIERRGPWSHKCKTTIDTLLPWIAKAKMRRRVSGRFFGWVIAHICRIQANHTSAQREEIAKIAASLSVRSTLNQLAQDRPMTRGLVLAVTPYAERRSSG